MLSLTNVGRFGALRWRSNGKTRHAVFSSKTVNVRWFQLGQINSEALPGEIRRELFKICRGLTVFIMATLVFHFIDWSPSVSQAKFI